MSDPVAFSELADKTIPEILKLIAEGKLAGDALNWAKKRVAELWAKKEYGFTLEPEVASELQRISRSEVYKRMKECIGKHRFLSLVKLGLRIAELSEEGKVETIAKIKEKVYANYELEGIRILSMGSTGVLEDVVLHLSSIKIKKDYRQVHMAKMFEKILEDWTKMTIFHMTEHGPKELERKIVQFMNNQLELFFVFAIGSAGEQAKRVVATLSNNKSIRKNRYMFDLCSRKEDKVGREMYSWSFVYLKKECFT